jgi:hypothetical protein
VTPLLLNAPEVNAPEVGQITATLEEVRARHGVAAVHGIAPGLVVDDPTGWISAERFADGTALPELLDAARRRWGASPAAAAALAWKSYTYWVSLPGVVGYAAAGRVPDLSAGNVLIRVPGHAPFLEVGLRTPAVAVRPGDRLAGRPYATATVDLPGYLRRRLVDEHLAGVLDGLHRLARVGRRTLLGSLASGVAYGLVRSAEALPGPVLPAARTLLRALDVDHLVEIGPDLEVQRRTCCLAFTLPQPKVCSGCCIPSGAAAATR